MGKQRVKFATQIDEAILVDIRQLAKDEGRQIQIIIEEALESHLKKKGFNRPSADVMKIAERLSEDYSETLKYLAQ